MAENNIHDDKRTLENVFRLLYPFFAVVCFIVMIGVIFNTFDLALDVAFYNIVLALPVFGLLLMNLRRFHAAAIISSILAFILYYIDQYVFSARLTHIRFSDYQLISQVARVANRYHLVWNMEMTRRLGLVLLIFAFLFFIFHYFELKYSWKSAFFTGLGITVLSSAVILSGAIPSAAEDFDFSGDAEHRGLLYSWYCQYKESGMKEPEGYSREKAEMILAQYTETAENSGVNVIVIMNESLADYSLIGEPIFEDILPFIHRLVERGEAFEGKLVVSVFGGGTANTEYEFLTGNSAAFLPENATPYLQYVDSPEDNLASELNAVGYSTVAIHPYFSEEWNRSQVYQFFCFDRFISGVDFGDSFVGNGKSATATVPGNLISFGEGPLYVRGLISDQTSFERVLQENGERSFIFNVTMQNHGGYDYNGEDFTADEYVSVEDRRDWTGKKNLYGMLYSVDSANAEEEADKVNQYLTCANLSDKAFEYLITELKKSNQKTVVLMFGDHQPGIMISEHYVDVDKGIDPDYTVPYTATPGTVLM